MNTGLVREFEKLLGPSFVLYRPENLLLYEYDGSVEKGRPDLVVFPDSTEDVSRIVKLAAKYNVPIVGRGAGTGLSGGALARTGGVMLVFARMNRILELDIENQRAVVQPGVVNYELTRAAEPHGLYFAPDPSSWKSCTIGGNVAENAGGPHTLAYGVTTNHVTALELVLPSGEIVRVGSRHGYTPGYDLTGLLVGSEGTLALVTEITVKLSRKPEAVKTLFAIFDSIDDAADTVVDITARAITPTACEILDGWTLRAVEDYIHAGFPMDSAAVLLIEVEGLVETAFNQIVHYDPGDLTLSAGAGTPIAKLNATLFEHHQFLPLLVPWYSRSTLGGTIASGIDSPLSQFYGTARDFLIGAEFVTGSGALTKSGGRVVKNVTGYDLHKLLIGSLGTLAVITRLNFRTFPAPLAGSRGFVASFPNAEGALALRRTIAQSPFTPLTFDIVSPCLAQIFSEKTPATPETAVFSGNGRDANQYSLPPIGDWFHPREWQLCAAFADESGAISTVVLDDTTRPSMWGRLRETLSMLLESSPATTIFKLSVLPSHHVTLFAKLQEIANHASLAHAFVAPAGGTIYFALLPPSANAEATTRLAQAATQILNSVSAVGGDTTLLFASPALKHAFCLPDGFPGPRAKVWGTLHHDLSLTHRLKSAFDPQNIFAPGRFLSCLP
jgi:FAD/FMN-containing dehydrogenase